MVVETLCFFLQNNTDNNKVNFVMFLVCNAVRPYMTGALCNAIEIYNDVIHQ